MEENKVDATVIEMSVLLEADHPFLARMDYLFQDEMRLYFVMPFIHGAEMYKYYCKKNYLAEDEVKFYITQIVLGVGYLHDKGIAHRDLKLENILVDQDGYVKLIDFGLASRFENFSEHFDYVGTPQYMAPEIYSGASHGFGVDWWAVGVLIYELLFGNVPFFTRLGNQKMA